VTAAALEYSLDEAPASAEVFAALVAILREPGREPLSLSLSLASPPALLDQLARTCARRGLTVELAAKAITVAGRTIPLVLDERPPSQAARARLHEGRIVLERRAKPQIGEPCELLAASPVLDTLERGGLRWAVLSTIEGRDAWHASVDLSERRSDASFEAALRRCFPALVGRVAFSSAIGPQLGAAMHLSVVLGAGESVDGLRDQLAHVEHGSGAGSPWPRLRARRGVGSADSFGQPSVLLDLDAIVGVGPLIRIAAYYDPPAILAGDLLRRLTT
jgi:hypothetical protein